MCTMVKNSRIRGNNLLSFKANNDNGRSQLYFIAEERSYCALQYDFKIKRDTIVYSTTIPRST